VHALVAYFSVEFSACHTPVRFSTGPRSEYTHWKQTVFYLDEPISACLGEVLKGVIKVKRNDSNKRDIDIEMETTLRGKHTNHKSSRKYKLR